jgi:menaquinone-9 beta-reductase
MSEFIQTDICIAGAGPAGATASLFLTQKKIPHIIIDKQSFPRDKVCGDALSGKVLTVIKKLGPDFEDSLRSLTPSLPSHGVAFIAPNGKKLRVPFKSKKTESLKPPGYTCTRWVFDNFLAENVKKSTFAQFFENTPAETISRTARGYEIVTPEKKIHCKILIAANGAHSRFARQDGGIVQEDEHYSAGLRQYFTGVSGLDEHNFIELHFIKELLPGYFWIFPMANGLVNVGLGMRSDVVSSRKLNLKKIFAEIISSHAEISQRFKNARAEETVKGYGLPLGSKTRKISGNSFMLTGDAASLIDPFTGEGISNAMFSGMYAADQAERCLSENNFSADFMKQYDLQVYRRLGQELKLSSTLQKLINYPWLFNFVVNKALKNKELSETIACMFDDMDLREKLKSPSFYFRLLR